MHLAMAQAALYSYYGVRRRCTMRIGVTVRVLSREVQKEDVSSSCPVPLTALTRSADYSCRCLPMFS